MEHAHDGDGDRRRLAAARRRRRAARQQRHRPGCRHVGLRDRNVRKRELGWRPCSGFRGRQHSRARGGRRRRRHLHRRGGGSLPLLVRCRYGLVHRAVRVRPPHRYRLRHRVRAVCCRHPRPRRRFRRCAADLSAVAVLGHSRDSRGQRRQPRRAQRDRGDDAACDPGFGSAQLHGEPHGDGLRRGGTGSLRRQRGSV